jgi:RNA 2',3'-cyclic 3'-phosphodiesterase
MRLFVGVDLTEPLRHTIALAVDDIRRQVAKIAPRAILRWIPRENLHITLWFLGEVGDEAGKELITVLHAPFNTPRFQLGIGGIGAFPESGPPRALWLGLVHGRESLLSIYGELTNRLMPLGYEPDTRAYSPHLTIARAKAVRGKDVGRIRRLFEAGQPDLGECTVDAVTLFRSSPAPTGPHYERLMRVRLG